MANDMAASRLFSAVYRARRECRDWEAAVARALRGGDVTTAAILDLRLRVATQRYQALRERARESV
jgi:hypothetical protein